MSKKYTAMYFLFFIVTFILVFLFLSWILQLSYNNSIPEMTKDVQTGKERFGKINYGTAIAFAFLLSFLPSTVLIYNGHLDK